MWELYASTSGIQCAVELSMYCVRMNANRVEYTGISITGPRGSVARTWYAGSIEGTGRNDNGTVSSATAAIVRNTAASAGFRLASRAERRQAAASPPSDPKASRARHDGNEAWKQHVRPAPDDWQHPRVCVGR